jgi:pilus assembly protein CpaF
MSPDRIIVGELRGGEAADFLEALNTGHSGSLTTLHANSAPDALERFITLVRRGDPAQPRDVIVDAIARGIEYVVHMEKRGPQRLVTEIAEIAGTSQDHQRVLAEPVQLTEGGASWHGGNQS